MLMYSCVKIGVFCDQLSFRLLLSEYKISLCYCAIYRIFSDVCNVLKQGGTSLLILNF